MGRRFAILIGVAAAGVMALGPATAWAEGETVVTYTGSPGAGSQISVVAAAGSANSFLALEEATQMELFDKRGIVESSPHCVQQSPTEVRCQADGLQRLSVNSGDGADVLAFGSPNSTLFPTLFPEIAVKTGAGSDRLGMWLGSKDAFGATVDVRLGSGDDHTSIDFQGVTCMRVGCPDALVIAGAGNDSVTGSLRSSPSTASLKTASLKRARAAEGFRFEGRTYVLLGGGGADLLRVKRGRAIIKGGTQGDTLRGGFGPQRISGNAGNDAISCGKGNDAANGGPGLDRGGGGCETLR